MDSGLHVDRSFKELVWNGMGDPNAGGGAEAAPVKEAPAPVALTLAALPVAGTVALTQPDGSPAQVLAQDVNITWVKLEAGPDKYINT